jgi:hypothetical protein
MSLDVLVVGRSTGPGNYNADGAFSRVPFNVLNEGIHMERKQLKRGASRAVHHDADHESCS